MAFTAHQQDEINARVYHSPGVEREYQVSTLTQVEALALLRHKEAFAERDVLDVGVGTGRTSNYLAPLARRYEGIDYSPVMVEHLKTHRPMLSVRLADMRDLSAFGDASFDFMLASNNVIDAVNEEGRERTLREAARVLRPGGMLMLSSHNRQLAGALSAPRPARSRNVARQALHLSRWVRDIVNYTRFAPAREVHADHALLTDEGHHHACLHYYVTQEYERRQLHENGFEVLEVLDERGVVLPPDDGAPDSASLMYVSRRVGGSLR